MYGAPSNREVLEYHIRIRMNEIELIKGVPVQNAQIQQEILIELNNQLEVLLQRLKDEITPKPEKPFKKKETPALYALYKKVFG